MEGRKEHKSVDVAVYDLEQRRLIDEECTRRTIEFMNEAQRGRGETILRLRSVHPGALPDAAEHKATRIRRSNPDSFGLVH
jgi:hypothetical protein